MPVARRLSPIAHSLSPVVCRPSPVACLYPPLNKVSRDTYLLAFQAVKPATLCHGLWHGHLAHECARQRASRNATVRPSSVACRLSPVLCRLLPVVRRLSPFCTPPSTKCPEIRISLLSKQLSRPLCVTDCGMGILPMNARDSAHPETPPVPHVPPKAAASRPACADLPAPQAGLRQAGRPEAPFARRPSPVACPLSPVNCRTFLHYNED
jgi:hypothetical protein